MQNRLSRLLPPTLLLAVSALLSRFIGVYRDHLLAKTFGATSGTGIFNLDVYYAAFRVPDLIYNLLVLGAVSAAFIPIFTQYKKQNDLKNAWEFASSVLHMILIAIGLISGLIYIFAPALAHVLAGGFNEEQVALTARLMRIMLLSPIFFAFASVLIGIQDSFKTFFYRSLAPLFYNGGIVLGVIFFGEHYGVVGVTWGVVLGALLQLLIQLPSLWQVGYKHVWTLGFRRPDVRKSLLLIVPRVIGSSVDQIVLIAATLIASFLGTGAITVFYLANNLNAMPLGIISVSFAITSFATLSELASEPTTDAFANEIRKVTGRVLFLIIPAIAGILILKSDIINALLVYGKFSAEDAELTSKILGILVVSLFAQSLMAILARGFFAYHDTKTPLYRGIASAIIAIGGGYFFAVKLKMGILGIALGFSLGDIINFFLLYIMLSRKIGHNVLDWLNAFKMTIASLVMAAAVIGAMAFHPIDGAPLIRVGLLGLYVGLGIVVYFGAAHLFKIKEVHMFFRFLNKPVKEAPQENEMKTAGNLMD
jgi:putative peptidoglycan lipid II flippase